MKINGIEITAKEFAYDGCHKIYLIESQEERDEADSYGYKIYPINEIADKFDNSCSLRFIDTWSLDSIVPQFEERVHIEWEGGEYNYCAEEVE